MKSSVWDLKMPYKTKTVTWYKAGMCIGLFSFLIIV